MKFIGAILDPGFANGLRHFGFGFEAIGPPQYYDEETDLTVPYIVDLEKLERQHRKFMEQLMDADFDQIMSLGKPGPYIREPGDESPLPRTGEHERWEPPVGDTGYVPTEVLDLSVLGHTFAPAPAFR